MLMQFLEEESVSTCKATIRCVLVHIDAVLDEAGLTSGKSPLKMDTACASSSCEDLKSLIKVMQKISLILSNEDG